MTTESTRTEKFIKDNYNLITLLKNIASVPTKQIDNFLKGLDFTDNNLFLSLIATENSLLLNKVLENDRIKKTLFVETKASSYWDLALETKNWQEMCGILLKHNFSQSQDLVSLVLVDFFVALSNFLIQNPQKEEELFHVLQNNLMQVEKDNIANNLGYLLIHSGKDKKSFCLFNMFSSLINNQNNYKEHNILTSLLSAITSNPNSFGLLNREKFLLLDKTHLVKQYYVEILDTLLNIEEPTAKEKIFSVVEGAIFNFQDSVYIKHIAKRKLIVALGALHTKIYDWQHCNYMVEHYIKPLWNDLTLGNHMQFIKKFAQLYAQGSLTKTDLNRNEYFIHMAKLLDEKNTHELLETIRNLLSKKNYPALQSLLEKTLITQEEKVLKIKKSIL